MATRLKHVQNIRSKVKIFESDRFLADGTCNLDFYQHMILAGTQQNPHQEVPGQMEVEGTVSPCFPALIGKPLTLHLDETMRIKFLFQNSHGRIVFQGIYETAGAK